MNETEIVFKVDKPGDARAVLRQVDGLVDTIGVSAVAAGVKLDKNLVDSLAKMSPRALEQINAELLKIAPNASAAAAALNRVNGAGGGAVGRGPADAVMTDDRVMRRKFDNAARGLNGAEKLGGQMREVAVQADKSAMNVQKLGVALSALPAEIPVLGALSAGGGIGLLVGAAGAIAFKLKSITDSVRESYELVGKLEAKRNVNMYGLTGGADQRTKELQGLRDLQRETAKLAKAGAYDEIRKLHESVVDSFMSDDQLASRIGQAVGGLQRLGGDTRSTGEIENIKKLTEARKKATEDFNEFSRNHFEEEERGYQRLKELEKAAAAASFEGLAARAIIPRWVANFYIFSVKWAAASGGFQDRGTVLPLAGSRNVSRIPPSGMVNHNEAPYLDGVLGLLGRVFAARQLFHAAIVLAL